MLVTKNPARALTRAEGAEQGERRRGCMELGKWEETCQGLLRFPLETGCASLARGARHWGGGRRTNHQSDQGSPLALGTRPQSWALPHGELVGMGAPSWETGSLEGGAVATPSSRALWPVRNRAEARGRRAARLRRNRADRRGFTPRGQRVQVAEPSGEGSRGPGGRRHRQPHTLQSPRTGKSLP